MTAKSEHSCETPERCAFAQRQTAPILQLVVDSVDVRMGSESSMENTLHCSLHAYAYAGVPIKLSSAGD